MKKVSVALAASLVPALAEGDEISGRRESENLPLLLRRMESLSVKTLSATTSSARCRTQQMQAITFLTLLRFLVVFSAFFRHLFSSFFCHRVMRCQAISSRRFFRHSQLHLLLSPLVVVFFSSFLLYRQH